MTQFHIGIRNGKQLRKNILESLKAVVATLQQYDQWLEYRRQRQEEIENLRQLLRDISVLNAKLGKEMPRSKAIPARASRSAGRDKKEVTKEGAQRLSKISKLSKLSKQLSAIEDELKKMG